MRTGILGGTFDPIHIGHLHTAECALDQLGLDRVLIVPAGDPWQKGDRAVSGAEGRLRMCELAVQHVDGLQVDDSEVRREGPTYTVDTLEAMGEAEELFLIVGADAAAGLQSWHRWQDVLARSTLVVAPRRGVDPPVFAESVALTMGLLEVSGTYIRSAVADGRPWRFLVTTAVHDYIVANGLYAQRSGDDRVGKLEIRENSP